MKKALDLSPFGTAREAITGASPAPLAGSLAASEPELLSWFRKIREPLKALYNIEDEIALVAWELARWQDGLGLSEQQALILLILTVLVQLRQGSTRICLRGEKGRSIRLDLASRLLKDIEHAPGAIGLEPVQAVELVETLIDSQRLGAVVGLHDEFKPLVVSGDHLYLQKMLYLENRFVEVLRHRLDAAIEEYDDAIVERALRDVLDRPGSRDGQPLTLTTDQELAVRAATRYPLTIISGGPGTGKTTIILSILRTLRRLGVSCEEIALAAPTGKAANRIGEAIKAGPRAIALPAPEDLDLVNLGEPRTLHRLLGYSQRTGRFSHHENNRLAERVVIVDESSMIDLALMERLVRSLRDGSRLILLGDAHQLPSVEAGDVLRDLLKVSETSKSASHVPFGVRLEVSHRMQQEDKNGNNILAVARAIDNGDIPTTASSRTSDQTILEPVPQTIAEYDSVAKITFQGVEFVASDGTIVLDEFLDRWHREQIRSKPDVNEFVQRDYGTVDGRFSEADEELLEHCFKHWEQFRILCVTRVSQATGADRVNAALHQRLLDELGLALHRDHHLSPGEPVMMQVNDYGRGIFNGDQGLILNVALGDHPEPMAVFRRSGRFAAFHVDSLRSVLVHSYAMTVHKAQGSEFNTLGLILPDIDLPINTREIIYTALTRSRQGVVIIGSREIFEAGIRRKISRDTGIVAKLIGATG
jgi:exodeoxyribonuclease V alpha subunit